MDQWPGGIYNKSGSQLHTLQESMLNKRKKYIENENTFVFKYVIQEEKQASENNTVARI